MPRKYTPRLSVELTEKQFYELQRIIPWGQKRKIFGPIVDDIISMTKRHGRTFIAALMARAVSLEDFLEIDMKEFDNDYGRPEEINLRNDHGGDNQSPLRTQTSKTHSYQHQEDQEGF